MRLRMDGRVLKYLRVLNSLSVADLSRQSGVPRAQIEHIELQVRARPELDVLESLAKPLGYTGEELAGLMWVGLPKINGDVNDDGQPLAA